VTRKIRIAGSRSLRSRMFKDLHEGIEGLFAEAQGRVEARVLKQVPREGFHIMSPPRATEETLAATRAKAMAKFHAGRIGISIIPGRAISSFRAALLLSTAKGGVA
jgi:hypothetical protein